MELKKLNLLKNHYLWQYLGESNQEKLINFSDKNRLSFQMIRVLLEIIRDFEMWGEFDSEFFNNSFKSIQEKWHFLKTSPKTYSKDIKTPPKKTRVLETTNSGRKIFGSCPVESPNTLCCKLKTIDAVQNCNYGCQYCSIQTFYKKDKISFEENLEEKLNSIELDPKTYYHFGTGQSSDSLMWGNHNNTLETLINFARKNPNVLLEFKTKSNNIEDFLSLNPPANVVPSWSLNPDIIIKNEELYTASLDARLKAAKKVQDNNLNIAFHFHPIIYFENFQEEYQKIAQRIMAEFDPEKVLYISLGTLTFIKPAIKAIRERGNSNKILMMPFEEVNGRYSYPKEIKLQLFKTVYDSFQKWHDKVFFYLCMEPKEFWKPVFNFEFKNNEEFEKELLLRSFKKINERMNIS